jgi:hypothetical protein
MRMGIFAARIMTRPDLENIRGLNSAAVKLTAVEAQWML